MATSQQVKGWFTTAGRPGDRTLESQKIGLERLYAAVRGKTLLDIGSAEGLLTMDLVSAGGAVAAHGVEIVKGHIEVAHKLQGTLPICFEQGDANTWTPKRQYDVVTLLAVLHKLKNPTAACARFAAVARELVVIRLPPLHAPTVIDAHVLAERHAQYADLVQIASAEIDWLYDYIAESGYALVLTDASGIILYERTDETLTNTFRAAGLTPASTV